MKSVQISLTYIIAALIIGPSIILTVGLLCGLVARPNNCIDRPIEPTTLTTTSPLTTRLTQTSNLPTTLITGSVTARDTTSIEYLNFQIENLKLLSLKTI